MPMTTDSMIRSTKLGAVVGLFALIGCAPTAPFQDATSNNAVKVEIRGDQLVARWWTLYTFDNGDTCQGRKVVAGSTTNKNADIRVEPGKRQSYLLWLEDAGSTCRIAMSFNTVAGNIYSVRVASDRQRCYMATLNTTKTVEGTKEPTTVRRTAQTAFVESGPWCAPLNPSDMGKPIESTTVDADRSQLPKAPDGSRQGATLDDLKDLLPKDK